jgi:outer membrane protein assembly factor BamB
LKDQPSVRELNIIPNIYREQEGPILILKLKKPIEQTKQLKVRIGSKDAENLVIPDPWTIICLAPADEVGSKDVTIFDGKNELVKSLGAITYVKKEEESSQESDQKEASNSDEGGNSKKPGDPTRPASNWWMLYRDLEHTSMAPTDNVVPLSKLWQRTFSDALGFTQPIVGDDTLLVGVGGNGDEIFVALNPATGDVLWTRTKEQIGNLFVFGTPVAVNGRVYFVEFTTGTSKLTCLSIEDGSEVWSINLPSSSQSGLAAAFGNIYLLTRDGTLRAHNAQTGAEVWQTPGIDVGSGNTLSSPAIGFGNIYVGSNQGIRVFDAINGTPKWSAVNSPSNGNASPVIVYDVGVGNPAVVVIGYEDNKLRGYKVTDGSVLWEYTSDRPLWYTTPSLHEGNICLMQDRTVVKLNAVTGDLLATSPNLGDTIATGPTIAKEHLFVIMWDDRLLTLQLSSLAITQHTDTPSHGYRPPSVEKGRLFFFAAESEPYPSPNDTIYAYHKACLIATAAYGSPFAPPVSFLRNIRDGKFRRSVTGGLLMDALEHIYYKFSPRVAQAMYEHTGFKRAIRWIVVAPFVYLLMIIVKPWSELTKRIRRFRNR